jgi:type I restriction enzyme S subunit
MREDWIETYLPNVCDILDNLRKPINSAERTKRIEGKKECELYPYYGATGQVGFIDNYLTDGNYVLIGEDAAPFLDYTKDVAYKISGKTWVNNHAHILKSHYNDDFLLHFLNQFQYRDFVTGTTRLKLTQSALKRIPVKLAPLPEQRAIVLKIENLFASLDKGIADLKTAQEQLKVYRQAVLKKAFEGEYDFSDPKNWEYQPFKECLKFSQGIQIDVKFQSESKRNNQVRFLRIIDFTQGDEPERYIDNPGEKYIVKKEDISLVRYGASTGFVCSKKEGAIA